MNFQIQNLRELREVEGKERNYTKKCKKGIGDICKFVVVGYDIQSLGICELHD